MAKQERHDRGYTFILKKNKINPSYPVQVLVPVVLVVDTHHWLLTLYEEVLENGGFSVFVTDDTNSALRLAQLVKPDLILLDLRVPQLEAFGLFQVLKSTHDTYSIPIVFISGTDDRAIVEQAYALGAVDFILKPCRSNILVSRLRKHLDT